jgi:hypothetical protein
MKYITVEPLNERALALLNLLEKLQIIRVIKPSDRPVDQKRKWAGSISSEVADKMLLELNKTRDEWDRGF